MATGTGTPQDPFAIRLPNGTIGVIANDRNGAQLIDQTGAKLTEIDGPGLKQLAVVIEAVADGRTEHLAVSLRDRKTRVDTE